MRAPIRAALALFVLMIVPSIGLGQMLPSPLSGPPPIKEQINKATLEQAVRALLAATRDSQDEEVLAAHGVMAALLGAMLTDQTAALLMHVEPFARDQVQKLRELRRRQRPHL